MSVAEIVFVLGPPGAGKGTQCSNIKENFGYIHLSAGDLLRAEQTAGSDDGELIADYIKNGKIVPIEITIRLLEKAIVASGKKKVLIDGFPRNQENLAGWEEAMVTTGKMRTKFMLYFSCAEEECLSRAMGRNQNRADDNVESFKKRIATYTSSTVPVLEEFTSRGLLRTIDANGTAEQVWSETQKLFKSDTMTALEPSITSIPLPIPAPSSSVSSPTAPPQPITDRPVSNTCLTPTTTATSPAAPNIRGVAESLYAALDSITAPALQLPSPPPLVSESVVLCVEEGESALVPVGQGEGLFSLCNIL